MQELSVTSLWNQHVFRPTISRAQSVHDCETLLLVLFCAALHVWIQAMGAMTVSCVHKFLFIENAGLGQQFGLLSSCQCQVVLI